MAAVPLLLTAVTEVAAETKDSSGGRERLQDISALEWLKGFSSEELRLRWVIERKEWGPWFQALK
jgi:hypothetical protein